MHAPLVVLERKNHGIGFLTICIEKASLLIIKALTIKFIGVFNDIL